MIRSFLGLMLVAAITLAAAQDGADRDYKLRVDVQLVQLPVSVLDKHGLSVTGLPQDIFSVYEDKVLQNITLFKQEDMPISGGLLIDVSGSMLSKAEALKAAARTFIQARRSDDEMAIMTFADDVLLEQDFNGDTANANTAATESRYSQGTALFDSVLEAASYIQGNSAHEKQVLIIISDGEDNNSRYRLREVLTAVSESKIIIYTVGLLTSDSYSYRIDLDAAKTAMRQLAEITGGAYFFPRSVKQVEEVCKKIAADLRSQYTIGYRPSNDRLDGSWRRVVVRVNPPKNTPALKVRTKTGYYAPVGKPELAKGSVK